MTRRIEIPELALVLLIGISGSGKSTFARRHFLGTEVISSDTARGLVSDDENDQSATADAFDVVHYLAGKRLARGKIAVIDATNIQPEARKSLVAVAREHDVLPVAIIFDVPEKVCLERTLARADRDFGAQVIKRQGATMRRHLKGLAREGIRMTHTLSADDFDDVEVVRTKLYNDLRHETGPFDVIGDVHGCRSELETLLDTLGYAITRDSEGRAVDAAHPEGRRAVLVGDLVDRGPDTPGVLRLAMGMVRAGHAFVVSGNHEAKLVRALSAQERDRLARAPGLARPARPAARGVRGRRSRVDGRADLALRAGRGPSGGGPRGTHREVPRPRFGPSARLLPVRRHHGRD